MKSKNIKNMIHNTDKVELEKFAKIASQWWDQLGPCAPLHQLNPLRLKFIQDNLNVINKKILDVGCGGGILSESLAIQGAIVTGIDATEEVIYAAKFHQQKLDLNIEYYCASIENFSERIGEKFDVITCMELIEHVPDPLSLIMTCKKLLKPQGHLFISTLNRTLKSYLYAIIGAEYLLQFLPLGTHDYKKFIKPSELDLWARHAELTLKKIVGIHYNPLLQKFSFTADVNVNYLVYYQNDEV